ncbi:MAG: hypothetical protein Kow0098_18160 [Ignavibacteriaceae bacterium]
MKFIGISKSLGFTDTEFKILLTLAGVFLIGIVIRLVFKNPGTVLTEYDYFTQDSIFLSSGYPDSTMQKDFLKQNLSTDVDYKQEVLDFNTSGFTIKKPEQLPSERSIEINSANLETLMKLPGIGEKTAKKIIELRESRGGFRELKELMEVKGIGKTKFNNIKKFLYIEQ